MNFFKLLIDALVDFYKRNPLLVLLIVFLCVASPALVKGVLAFVLYFVLGIIILGVILSLVFRYKVEQMQKRMRQRFDDEHFGGENPGASRSWGGFAGFGNNASSSSSSSSTEGDVKIYKTSASPEKKVSKNVGDYIDFEETKQK